MTDRSNRAADIGVFIEYDEAGELGLLMFRSFFELPSNVVLPEGWGVASPNGQFSMAVIPGPLYDREPPEKIYERDGAQVRVSATMCSREIGAGKQFMRLSVSVGRARPSAFDPDRLLAEVPKLRADTRLLVGCLAEPVRETFFSRRALDVIVGAFSDGLREIRTAVSVATTTPVASRQDLEDQAQLSVAERAFLSARSDSRLTSAVSFVLQAEEGTDWLLRFTFSYLAIECLCSRESLPKTTKAERSALAKAAIARLRDAGTPETELDLLTPLVDRINNLPLSTKFELYAQRWALPGVDQDIVVFKEASRRRNKLLHSGDLAITADDAMAIQALAEKYTRSEVALLRSQVKTTAT